MNLLTFLGLANATSTEIEAELAKLEFTRADGEYKLEVAPCIIRGSETKEVTIRTNDGGFQTSFYVFEPHIKHFRMAGVSIWQQLNWIVVVYDDDRQNELYERKPR